MSPAGRRPGPTTTSAEILAAARALFAQGGYPATTMRAVAERAGVNQALIRHFYGSKQQLFLAATSLPADAISLMLDTLEHTPRDVLGEHIVRAFVRIWQDSATSPQVRAFFRAAAGTEEGASTARQLADHVLVPRVTAILGIEPTRVAAMLAQLLGYAFLARIVGATPLAAATEDDVVALLSPTIQGYLDS